ncbi:hypothetical protein OF83DRAFT_1175630, partial [Amylostereum chailletii]
MSRLTPKRASNRPTRTRKSGWNMENQVPAQTQHSNTDTTPEKTPPRPRPIIRVPPFASSPSAPQIPRSGHDNSISAENTAAQALVTMCRQAPTTSPGLTAASRNLEQEIQEVQMRAEEAMEQEDDPYADADGSSAASDTLPTEEEEISEFGIEFLVPVPAGNTVHVLESNDSKVTSLTPFAQVLAAIALCMGTSISFISGFGYLPSYLPKSELAKATPMAFDDKGWRVLIRNDTTEASTMGRGGKNSKPAPPASRTAVPDKAALADHDAKELEIMKLIENKHRCQTDKVPCLIQANGVHYKYTPEDLAKWAHLVAKYKATIDFPPPELNLEDKISRQALVKTKAPLSNTSAGGAVDFWAELATNVAQRFMAPPPSLPPSTSTPPAGPDLTPVHRAVVPAKRHAPLDYPGIEEWFTLLD